jgi:enterochelin esterase-like enzyme
MRKTAPPPAGAVHRLVLDSALLKGNRAGDPSERPLLVYTPPGFDPAKRYPLFVDIVGYCGSGASHANWRPFGLSLPERLDRLIADRKMGPVVAALPDCFTCYGGNQYIDSHATGPYMRYLVEEVVPFVEKRFPILPGRDHRALFGKSSGGYGAFVHGMTRADAWGAVAAHSGDAYFEYAYMSEFPKVVRELGKHGGSLDRFLEAIWAKEKLSNDETMALMAVGMAAHYDADPEAPRGFHLPFDPETGAILPERWARWLPHDPVRLVDAPGSAAALKSLRGIWIDCGTKDQFHLLWGNRMVHRRLEALGVPHEYREFDDDHSDVDYRMDESLPFLYGRVGPG